jgi:hypothetical protein
MRRTLRLVTVLVFALLAPALVYAQASITGVVRDASGAVLPGVAVEASSPALIEKVRSVSTDGSGQYRIIDLRPGTYTVTFALQGFSTVQRTGIELTGAVTATINADLRVGTLEETVTVTGQTPVVDVQSVRRQTTVDNAVITSLPTSRSYGSIMQLMPSLNTGNTQSDVQIAPNMTVFGGAGGRGNEGRLQVDGLGTGTALNGAGISTYIADVSNASEVTFTTSGGLGEAEVGGPAMSIVPRTGGNTFKGSGYFAGVSEGMVGSNYTDRVRTAGLSTPGQLLKLWDVNLGLGGPILRDRLWFYGTYRDEGSYRSIPGIYPNLNAGDSTKWTYEPDRSRQAQGAESWTILTLRLTAQAGQRNKFNIYWDEQIPCNGAAYFGANGCREQPESGAVIGVIGLGGLTATTSPEISGYLHTTQRVQQLTWQSPATNRLLLEAGLGTFLARWGPQDAPGNPTKDLIRVTEQCAAGCGANGGIANLTYRSANWNSNWSGAYRWRASASYVTGANNMRFGYQGSYYIEDDKNFSNSTSLAYRFNNGAPNQFTQTINQFERTSRTALYAFFAEDQWTRGRFTFQGALRYDNSWSWFPEQQVGPHRFLPTPIVFEETDGVNYKDITPRVGVAWDVFGTGRTAVKVNIGRYLEPASNGNGNYSATNPTSRITTTTSRTWIDGNNNFIVDCDLLSMAAQNNLASGGDSCAAGTASFGQNRFADTYDPELLRGWFVRPDDWGFNASVQQQLLPRVSAEVTYTRRWLSGFTAVDNQSVAATDFGSFSVTAPSDPRLPGNGGYSISNLYDVNPDKFGQVNNLNTLAENYGKRTQVYNGVSVSVSARPSNGLTLQGGLNSGSTVQDSCEIRRALPESAALNPYCHNAPGLITRVTGLASYTVPRIDVLFSSTFRSDQGQPLSANYNVPSSAIIGSLGRNLSAGATSFATVNLAEPGSVWGDRVNEIDLRIAKVLRFGRTRSNIGVDIYNLFNSDAILTYNQTFSPTVQPGQPGAWLTPQSLLSPRFVKFSAQIDF